MAQTHSSVILAADVGGTKTHMALFTVQGRRLRHFLQQSFASRQVSSLEAMIRQFLQTAPHVRVSRAAFGVAGPVLNGTCHTPNLPWVVDERRLRSLLQVPAVEVINDLEAMAYGIERVSSRALVSLQAGRPVEHGRIALIAAGTGLGEAFLCWDGRRYRPSPSEGGHADFAPRNALEMELLRFLWADHQHVSYERVVSGPGLVRIYRFLRQRSRRKEPVWLTAALRHRDAGAVITQSGLSRRDACCRHTVELFASLYGAEAGNLAMKTLATGGVYLGGGIAPKILPVLRGDGFLRAFVDKGRMHRVLSQIPVRVMLDEQSALLGAAHYAWLRASSR